MKTLKITFCTLCVLALFSCNNRTTDKDNTMGTEATTDTYDQNPADRNVTGTEAVGIDEDTADNTTWNTQDMTDMYKNLNMTPEQIEQFENDYKQKQSNRTSDNIVDNNLVDLQMDESLKEVLSAEQYAKYQEWKKSHPVE